MIDGHKVVAFTPVGRKRFVDILAAYVKRDHDRGIIDEWVLFKNPYTYVDEPMAQQYADGLNAQYAQPWVRVIENPELVCVVDQPSEKNFSGPTIGTFYKKFVEIMEDETVYLRLDDDVCYIDEHFTERLARFRLAHREPMVVFPTIVNNTRTTHHLQQAGILPQPEWEEVKNEMADYNGCINPVFCARLHQKALRAIEEGKLVETFKLPDRMFDDWQAGRISINAFAIMGNDFKTLRFHPDEESYFAWWAGEEAGRYNARCGDAVCIHFAFGLQTEYMDQSGVRDDYVRIADRICGPLGFRTVQRSPTKWPPLGRWHPPTIPRGWKWGDPLPRHNNGPARKIYPNVVGRYPPQVPGRRGSGPGRA